MHLKSILNLVFVCFFNVFLFSQNASLSGKITDSKTNEALFGAKVILQGLGKGAVTDGDGNYSLKGLSVGTYILEVRNETYNNLILTEIKLKENDFSFCPEITTKVGLLKLKIKEIPIKYNGRNYSEGKKIKFSDGVKAVITLFKYRFF